ncbi:LPS biosynthesis protein WbpG [Brevundimonas denitrificans]|uniref:LPS biosynthesis protein WbpG n=1 Tax=Brevundimonas denitrificans TaxID=1443434 RepID=A0ABQ6BI35_9CAUL|nr:N-acetyl sugar amidotransferase [Brevundimonas denitrificans]GLS00176.1 LPS biosynthesis protein WbpG [Brevundimonas denitrificans]
MSHFNNPFTDILHQHPYRECHRCLMDTSDPKITFDDEGVCNHCRDYDVYMARAGDPSQRQAKLDAMVAHLKRQGKGKPYDCIMGLSGGVDSSYLAWLAVKKLGLRPLVVHVDAGWNSELAVNNIQNIVQRLGLDLHTLVIDWEEIRDLQRAFFLSGIANLDVPQDHAYIASLMQEARKYGIRDILNGGNMQTESILPSAWGYDASDPVSIKGIHARFGTVRLKRYPMQTNWDRLVVNPFIRRMRTHRPLEYIDYNKDAAKELLKSELGWRDYGGKHYESIFTKFFQAHYLPTKFGYDKRLAHLSSLIVSGQMTKQEARAEMQNPLYDPVELEEDRSYWVKKLGLSRKDYDKVMAERPSLYTDFPNSESLYNRIRAVARLVAKAYRKIKPRS